MSGFVEKIICQSDDETVKSKGLLFHKVKITPEHKRYEIRINNNVLYHDGIHEPCNKPIPLAFICEPNVKVRVYFTHPKPDHVDIDTSEALVDYIPSKEEEADFEQGKTFHYGSFCVNNFLMKTEMTDPERERNDLAFETGHFL